MLSFYAFWAHSEEKTKWICISNVTQVGRTERRATASSVNPHSPRFAESSSRDCMLRTGLAISITWLSPLKVNPAPWTMHCYPCIIYFKPLPHCFRVQCLVTRGRSNSIYIIFLYSFRITPGWARRMLHRMARNGNRAGEEVSLYAGSRVISDIVLVDNEGWVALVCLCLGLLLLFYCIVLWAVLVFVCFVVVVFFAAISSDLF